MYVLSIFTTNKSESRRKTLQPSLQYSVLFVQTSSQSIVRDRITLPFDYYVAQRECDSSLPLLSTLLFIILFFSIFTKLNNLCFERCDQYQVTINNFGRRGQITQFPSSKVSSQTANHGRIHEKV